MAKFLELILKAKIYTQYNRNTFEKHPYLDIMWYNLKTTKKQRIFITHVNMMKKGL